tara:strand:+ start:183 stop:392 length:210 start_codon:yes stop_codon:yes gene_type:complete
MTKQDLRDLLKKVNGENDALKYQNDILLKKIGDLEWDMENTWTNEDHDKEVENVIKMERHKLKRAIDLM